ncbi:hypothetical protein EMIT0P228_60243 [Pseudomonas brassicacearum]
MPSDFSSALVAVIQSENLAIGKIRHHNATNNNIIFITLDMSVINSQLTSLAEVNNTDQLKSHWKYLISNQLGNRIFQSVRCDQVR